MAIWNTKTTELEATASKENIEQKELPSTCLKQNTRLKKKLKQDFQRVQKK